MYYRICSYLFELHVHRTSGVGRQHDKKGGARHAARIRDTNKVRKEMTGVPSCAGAGLSGDDSSRG